MHSHKRSTIRNRIRRCRKRNRENIEVASLIRAYFKEKNGMKIVNAASLRDRLEINHFKMIYDASFFKITI